MSVPTGTPLTLKCPKCRRGKWGMARAEKFCRPTGETENRVTSSAQKGHGAGGPVFTGFRGQVRCGDCGHVWFSTHPSSGRRWACRCVVYGKRGKWIVPSPACKVCRGSGKVTEREQW